jgi:hypothetical protein
MANVLTKSPFFVKLVDWAYSVCDSESTGHIGKSELYAGLLLVHVNLARFAGPAACFVSSYLQLLDDMSRVCRKQY